MPGRIETTRGKLLRGAFHGAPTYIMAPMRDYFAESRLCATVKITGNLGITLGVALSIFHREQGDKIRRLEMSDSQETRYMVPLLKAELAEWEQWQRELDKVLAVQRAEELSEDSHG